MTEKVAMVYFSQTGNTEKVARRIAQGLERAGAQVDLMRLEETDPAVLQNYDFFGIGAPVFYYKLPFNVAWFINKMRGMEEKFAFGFLTEGGHAANTLRRMQKRLAKRRLVWPENGMNLHLLPPHDLGRRAIVLTWIDKNTTNRFYLGGRQIGFENEKDEVMFKLGFKL